jgi:hypothetical protein
VFGNSDKEIFEHLFGYRPVAFDPSKRGMELAENTREMGASGHTPGALLQMGTGVSK